MGSIPKPVAFGIIAIAVVLVGLFLFRRVSTPAVPEGTKLDAPEAKYRTGKAEEKFDRVKAMMQKGKAGQPGR